MNDHNHEHEGDEVHEQNPDLNHSHGHSHHHHKNQSEKALIISIIITFLFFFAELAGGLLSNSLTLLGDAFHMLRDGISLVISLGAIYITKKISTKKHTFGFHRVEIFAALINGILLIIVSVWMGIEAVERIQQGTQVDVKIMLIIGTIGLIANIYAAFALHGSENINVKSAFLHVLADTLSSVIVIIGAIWIHFSGNHTIDPIMSFLLSIFIFLSAIGVIKESIIVLLEFTPPGICVDDIIKEITKLEKVEEVHDFHIWSLTSQMNVAIMHILTNETNSTKQQEIKTQIRASLKKFNVVHSTLEFECERCHDLDAVNGACIDL